MSNRSIQMEDIKHLYIHITEISKTIKLIVSNKKPILFLKNDIVSKLTELGFNSNCLTEKNINIKYSGRNLSNNKYIEDYNIHDKSTLFVSITKLKGGTVGLILGLITVPSASLIINLLLLILWCPLQYFLLMYGSNKERVIKMMYSKSFLANFNNYKIRELLDDTSQIELKKARFPNFQYKLLKSRLYMIYTLFYFIFVTFFANLFPLNTFIDTYGKTPLQSEETRTGRCFINTATPQILQFGITILFAVPVIIFFLNHFGFQYGISGYILTLIIASIAIITSVYYKQTQNLKDAMNYMYQGNYPTISKDSYTPEVNQMPNYFGSLYISPLLCACIILFSYYVLKFKHSVVWGIICAFAAPIPLYYLMGNSLPIYCIQYKLLTRSAEQLQDAIKAGPDGKYEVNTANDIDADRQSLCFKLNKNNSTSQCNII